MTNDGKELENEVYELIKKMLGQGQLPYRKELCRLYRKKSYYSPNRKGNVEFENVLEVFTNDNVNDANPQPTHVIFFECKDHGRSVEVGKVDEVVGRLAVSFGFSMKGYIVTRKAFSKGALETARSNGIGLIKIMPEHKVRFLLHLLTVSTIERKRREFPTRAMQALFNNDYESDGESFYGIDDRSVFGSLADMLQHHANGLALEQHQ